MGLLSGLMGGKQGKATENAAIRIGQNVAQYHTDADRNVRQAGDRATG